MKGFILPVVELNTFVQNTVKLNKEETLLEEPITQKEAHTALWQMKNNKGTYMNGFTYEFCFKFFFNNISVFLVLSLNNGFLKGCLPVTQVLQKEGKPKQQI